MFILPGCALMKEAQDPAIMGVTVGVTSLFGGPMIIGVAGIVAFLFLESIEKDEIINEAIENANPERIANILIYDRIKNYLVYALYALIGWILWKNKRRIYERLDQRFIQRQI